MSAESRRALLCVDLDGTLVATDTLDECLLILVRNRPLLLPLLPLWVLGGKAYFKERVAAAAAAELESLPYRDSVCQYIDREAGEVDEVVLATAANWRIAQHVARECEFIQGVLASDATTNLSGSRKLAAIQAYAGDRPFDYIGDHADDLPIWRAARRAIVVSGSNRLADKINGASRVIQISPDASATARDWLRQLGVHQWWKNLLLVLPLVLAHKLSSPSAVFACLVAVIAFCCCASAVYIGNDLVDLPHDRQHPTKPKRPLARGLITIRQVLAAAAGLVAVAGVLSVACLPWTFLAMLVGYLVISFVDSVWLKRVPVMDVILLASFYVYRVLIGAVAIELPFSTSLLVVSIIVFFGVAIIQRYAKRRSPADSD
jgi:phosphoserine phosphatase